MPSVPTAKDEPVARERAAHAGGRERTIPCAVPVRHAGCMQPGCALSCAAIGIGPIRGDEKAVIASDGSAGWACPTGSYSSERAYREIAGYQNCRSQKTSPSGGKRKEVNV
jgi:hypothetical protein